MIPHVCTFAHMHQPCLIHSFLTIVIGCTRVKTPPPDVSSGPLNIGLTSLWAWWSNQAKMDIFCISMQHVAVMTQGETFCLFVNL